MDDTSFCVKALSKFFYPHLASTEDLEKHLEYCADSGTSAIREAISLNLECFDSSLKEKVPPSWKIVDLRSRTIITLLGQITYKRRIYLDKYGCRRYLLDEILGISTYQRIERNAFLWIVRKAADVSFQKTAKAFLEKAGVAITKQTVMRCVHECGRLLDKQIPKNDDPLVSPVLFCEFDGFWVHLQSETKQPAKTRYTYKEQFRKKSFEMKVWVAYAGKVENRRIKPLHWVSDVNPKEFFPDCLKRTRSRFNVGKTKYLISSSDCASWCKNNDLSGLVSSKTQTIQKLDTYHINQKIYNAFSSDIERSYYLDLLYSKNFNEFLDTLDSQIRSEIDEVRLKQRMELFAYISNNLDWLENSSLSRRIRTQLLGELPCVFADRHFYHYLYDLLSKRKYKRFICVLEKIVARCTEYFRSDYECFLKDAKHSILLLKKYGKTTLGTMEGTNAKVYAARLKVWGCAWSKRGALAMARIRATIFSGQELICPGYDSWKTPKEKKRISESFAKISADFIAPFVGRGYLPPQGNIVYSTLLPPKLQGLIY